MIVVLHNNIVGETELITGPFDTEYDAQDYVNAKERLTTRRLVIKKVERPY